MQFTTTVVPQSETTSLMIAAEAADDAATFTSETGGISSRPTTDGVAWSEIAPWTLEGEVGLNQRTPDLAPALQAIVDRPGWTSGNALALIVTGSGARAARSFDYEQFDAPLLHVEYGTGSPVAAVGPGRAATLELTSVPNPASRSATLRFTTPIPGSAALKIYDLRGRRVRTLTDGHLPAGRHEVLWDGRSQNGANAAQGIYLARLMTAAGEATSKIVWLP